MEIFLRDHSLKVRRHVPMNHNFENHFLEGIKARKMSVECFVGDVAQIGTSCFAVVESDGA